MNSWESRVTDAAIEVLAQSGLAGLTAASLARKLGASRMTLHRNKLTRERVIEQLILRAVDEYRRAVWPTLVSARPAGERLEQALRRICQVADAGRHLLVGLFANDGGIFHEPGRAGDAVRDLAIATRGVFIEPLARLLRDGIADGTVTPLADVDQTATVLFNQVGWTYLTLRVGQRWDPSRAEGAVVALAIAAVVDRSANHSNGTTNRC